MTYKNWKLTNDTLIQVSALVANACRTVDNIDVQVKFALPDVKVIDSIDKLFALQHPLKEQIFISQQCVADLLAFFAKQLACESNVNTELAERLQELEAYCRKPWYYRAIHNNNDRHRITANTDKSNR